MVGALLAINFRCGPRLIIVQSVKHYVFITRLEPAWLQMPEHDLYLSWRPCVRINARTPLRCLEYVIRGLRNFDLYMSRRPLKTTCLGSRINSIRCISCNEATIMPHKLISVGRILEDALYIMYWNYLWTKLE